IALYILIGSSIGFFFIKYAKSFATSIVTNYTKFNDRNSIKHGLEILKNILSDIFTFQTDENLLSFYAWLVLAILIIVIIAIFTKKLKIKFNNKQWLIVFVIDFVAILGIIILSKWVYVNGMGHWYFVPTYISLSLVILILFESVKTNTIQKKVLTILLGLAVFTGSLSTLHYLRYINPKTFKSQIDVKSEFLSLGEIGIIGNFWNSYIVACPNPSIIKATPHDAYVRNQNLVDEVFAQPKLYLIKNMWLNEFPDTINQFGYLLSKKGESFEIGGCKVNQYVRIQRNELIPLSDFSFYSSAIQNDSCILINKDSLLFNSKHHVWGPFIPVGIGKYTVKLQVEIEKAFMEESFALMDVVSNGGKTILASKELNFTNNKNIYELDFNCEKRYRNVEFRILSYGTLDFKILQVELIEK
ncbi:MAG: hypothetical protein C0597_13300, partial [Marinilabiliales bacterium]